jgi:hypothetical protein
MQPFEHCLDIVATAMEPRLRGLPGVITVPGPTLRVQHVEQRFQLFDRRRQIAGDVAARLLADVSARRVDRGYTIRRLRDR